jgi:hypothetical protein
MEDYTFPTPPKDSPDIIPLKNKETKPLMKLKFTETEFSELTLITT